MNEKRKQMFKKLLELDEELKKAKSEYEEANRKARESREAYERHWEECDFVVRGHFSERLEKRQRKEEKETSNPSTFRGYIKSLSVMPNIDSPYGEFDIDLQVYGKEDKEKKK